MKMKKKVWSRMIAGKERMTNNLKMMNKLAFLNVHFKDI